MPEEGGDKTAAEKPDEASAEKPEKTKSK